MNLPEKECPDCGQRAVGDFIFHELFCYDVYVVSAPAPQNQKQREIDDFMRENIVKRLELNGIRCYHGSRDICGGEYAISALSKPITVIPTTIVPVYKDRNFSPYRNLLLRVDYLDRIVFVMFDSTPIEPTVVSKNSFSIASNDPYLLPKLMRTITNKANQIPLPVRKRKLDAESAISTTSSEFQRNGQFRRSDTSRISFRVKPLSFSTVSEVGSNACAEIQRSDGDLLRQCSSITVSPHDLLSLCHSSSSNQRQRAAKTLARTIQKDFLNFSKNDNLEQFEKQIRLLRQKHNTMYFEKLYFWMSAAIFYRIYKYHDTSLKIHMKTLTLSKYEDSLNVFDQLCQETYYRLTASLHAKMNIWPNSLDTNDQHVKKFEDCLSMIDPTEYERLEKLPSAFTKFLSSLPWDIKHVFVVITAEKLFQKKYTHSGVSLFSEICDIIGKKHWPVFIDVIERVTDDMLDTYTKEPLFTCLEILENISKWKSRRRRGKDDKLNFVMKKMICKLIYHSVEKVRIVVSSLIFADGPNLIEISKLGSCCMKVREDLVEACIREHLFHSYCSLTIHNQVQIYSLHTLAFDAKTPEGDSLLYVFRQKTLNDVLITNSTDAAYEGFQEMLRAIKLCQGHNNIVTLRNAPSSSVLPFCVVEHGKSLLEFLHEKNNHLTWIQMMDILLDITKAVYHCHSKNVILREITPASFIVVCRENGTFQTKLANFQYAKCLGIEDPNNDAGQYTDINSLCFQGDKKEPIAAYFSAPETLLNKTFSKYSEAWILAANFYSIVSYGKYPFPELAHLTVSQFVNEIIAGHTVSIQKFLPKDLPEDLSDILSINLSDTVEERMMTETLLGKLEACKRNLEDRMDTVYSERAMCCYISSEDIPRGYVDEGTFIEELIEESKEHIYEDNVKLGNIQTVSVMMSLNTKRKLQQLNHNNIFYVNEIRTTTYTTILISTFNGQWRRLSKLGSGIGIDQLFSYLEQITLALIELHNKDIVHCDLRGDHIYINEEKGIAKVGHFGRAVSLESRQTYAFKMMPPDAAKWSAPEVRANHMYSKASDIFSLAAVIWELLSSQTDIIYSNNPLPPFHKCKKPMEEYANMNIPSEWNDSISTMLTCVKKCWNPNQTKRPSLNDILDTIQQILRNNEQYWSTSDKNGSMYSTEETEQEYLYETIIANPVSDFAKERAWKKVVTELESKGLDKNTTVFIEFKETCNYEDVGLPPTTAKRRLKPSNLL